MTTAPAGSAATGDDAAGGFRASATMPARTASVRDQRSAEDVIMKRSCDGDNGTGCDTLQLVHDGEAKSGIAPPFLVPHNEKDCITGRFSGEQAQPVKFQNAGPDRPLQARDSHTGPLP